MNRSIRYSAAAPITRDWLEHLKEQPLTEVNFWTPTPWNVRRLQAGDTFYFLLKAPIRKIGGYGRFIRYENLTPRDAWDKYGKGNGVTTVEDLISKVGRIAGRRSKLFKSDNDYKIGCIVLNDPVFFDEEDYIAVGKMGMSFPAKVVKHKYFREDALAPINPLISWALSGKDDPFELVGKGNKEYETGRRKRRKGCSQFRIKVLKAYDYKCAVSGETCDEVLDAAHIEDYINEKSNHVQNGISLRLDLHRLYDAGLIDIGADYKVKVSPHVHSTEYVHFDGKKIHLPQEPSLRPSRKALNKHSNRFRRS